MRFVEGHKINPNFFIQGFQKSNFLWTKLSITSNQPFRAKVQNFFFRFLILIFNLKWKGNTFELSRKQIVPLNFPSCCQIECFQSGPKFLNLIRGNSGDRYNDEANTTPGDWENLMNQTFSSSCCLSDEHIATFWKSKQRRKLWPTKIHQIKPRQIASE